MKNVNILFEEVGSRSSAGILRDFMTVIRDSPHQDPLASSDHRDSDRFIQVLDDLKRKKDEGPRMGSRANPIGTFHPSFIEGIHAYIRTYIIYSAPCTV